MTYRAPAGTHVGHIHLRVSDLDRAVAFYCDVLGFDVRMRYGEQAAFLAVGEYHHHIGLNTWDSKNGYAPAKGSTGLYHVAFVYPNRRSLGQAVGHVIDNGVAITGAADHGVSEAVYFDDPDGNGIELYWDRDPSLWLKDAGGSLNLTNSPLDVAALVAEAS